MKEKRIRTAFETDYNDEIDVSTGAETTQMFMKYVNDGETADISTENHWKELTTKALLRIAKIVVRVFTSEVAFDEMEEVRSFISSYLRKSKLWRTIRRDKDEQEIFTLGYIHALNQLWDLFGQRTPSKDDEPLINAVKTYKHIAPCVLALDAEFQLSHSDLAQRINQNKTSLSNFMRRISSYKIFDSTVVGRNRYYSLAQPNGHRTAALIKKIQTPSIEGDTSALTSVLNYLKKVSCDETDSAEALENCRSIVQRKTTTPNIIMKQLLELTEVLRLPRYPCDYVLHKERGVKSMVAIYTNDISSEKIAAQIVFNNITKKSIFYYYFTTAENTSEVQKQLKDSLTSYWDFQKPDISRMFKRQVRIINIKPESVYDFSEIVVYDWEHVYISDYKLIDENTLYTKPDSEKKEAILKMIKNLTGKVNPFTD